MKTRFTEIETALTMYLMENGIEVAESIPEVIEDTDKYAQDIIDEVADQVAESADDNDALKNAEDFLSSIPTVEELDAIDKAV
jgi:hypothetical protein